MSFVACKNARKKVQDAKMLEPAQIFVQTEKQNEHIQSTYIVECPVLGKDFQHFSGSCEHTSIRKHEFFLSEEPIFDVTVHFFFQLRTFCRLEASVLQLGLGCCDQ